MKKVRSFNFWENLWHDNLFTVLSAEFFGLDSKEDLYLPPLKLIANETKLEKLSLSPTEIPAPLVGLAR